MTNKVSANAPLCKALLLVALLCGTVCCKSQTVTGKSPVSSSSNTTSAKPISGKAHSTARAVKRKPRTNLIVAAVGDSSIHERWFEDSEDRTWELATFYFGKRSDFICEQCVHNESGTGTKWSFLYKFAKSDLFKQKFAKQYKQLYVTDDDIVQTSASMSKTFALMEQYGLLLAQPSLCSPFESQTWQNPLYKDPRVVLQYTTFVEIMVPLFNMQFFTSKVVATLEHAETGHGLDWVWPFILGYPQEKIAIINDVCVIHPKKELQPGTKLTIYKEHNPHAELVAVLAKFGYESELLRTKYDMGYLVPSWLGRKWQPWYEDLMSLAGIKDTYEVKNNAKGPHKGVRFVSSTSGAPGVARLQPHHRLRKFTKALNFLGMTTEPSTVQISGTNKYLVIVAVYDDSRWLRQNATAKYDVLAMASHNRTQQVQKACPHCVMVFGHDLEVTAGRYAALCQLIRTTQWQVQITGKYEYIYFPEDEIVQTVESVNRMFDLSAEYNLTMSHPSWCSPDDTISWHMDLLRMHPTTLLRHTTYVETAAPVWSRDFWNKIVAPSLKDIDRGFGLDFVWPYMASYPEDQIAVIDDVCIMRPTHILGPSALTRASKLTQDEIVERSDSEEFRTLIAHDYNPNKHRHIAYKAQDNLNWILQPWYQEMLHMNHLLVTPVRRWDMRLIIDNSP